MRILGIDPGIHIAGFSSDITCLRNLVFAETHHQLFASMVGR
jgi:hypothetical protein